MTDPIREPTVSREQIEKCILLAWEDFCERSGRKGNQSKFDAFRWACRSLIAAVDVSNRCAPNQEPRK